MLKKIIYTLAVVLAVFLVCILIGDLLNATKNGTLSQIGDFIGGASGLIAALAGLYYFFFGYTVVR